MIKILLSLFLIVLTIDSVNTLYEKEHFTLIEYEDINNLMKNLQESEENSSIFRINNVFDLYPEIEAPSCSKNTNEKIPCKSFLIEIGNFEKGEDFIKQMPTVFIVSGFHGNEVTGTNSMYHLIESIKKYHSENGNLTQILENVRILILITANVNGFYNLEREEFYKGESYDPNRDFPYNLQNDNKCFQTSTAMILDQIFRNNLIVSSLTFHGGDNSISYPWGNFAHQKDPLTGDNIAFSEVSQFLSKAAGNNPNINLESFKVGNLQSTVYDVYGGYEDWAYGASWDTINVPKNCSANNYQKNITYNDNTNRAFIFLVEAGYKKIPDNNELGNEIEMFEPFNKNSFLGYVSRCGFLSFRFFEINKPFITFNKIFYQPEQKDYLIFDVIIKGCLNVKDFYVSHHQIEMINNNYNSNFSYYNYVFKILNNQDSIPQLDFFFNCDKNWAVNTAGKSSQSHLVKMRTNKNYNVFMKNYSLNSHNFFRFSLLNLVKNKLSDAQIISNSNNIFSLVYTRKLIAQIPDDNIILTNSDNKVVLTSDKKIERKLSLEVPKLTKENTKMKFSFNNETMKNLNYDTFYNLIGRKVNINYQDKNYNSILKFDKEEDSYLFIPSNGLVGTESNEFGVFIFTIIPKKLESIFIEVLTNNDQDFKLIINNQEYLFNEKSIGKRKGVDIFKFDKYIRIDPDNLNQWRINGASINYDSLKGKKFDFILSQRNSYVNEYLDITFDNYPLDFQPKIQKNNYFYYAILTLIILVVLIFVYILISKKFKTKLEDSINMELDNLELSI